jgi:serine protease
MPLPFLISGAWDKAHAFALETLADLPRGARLSLQVPRWLGRALSERHAGLEEYEDADADADDRGRVRIPLSADGTHLLGQIELPAGTMARSQLVVHLPSERRDRPYEASIRQLHEGLEVGRITWRFLQE